MSVLGIGPLELLVVLVIALLVVGPEGLIKFARWMGRWLRRLRQSAAWREVTQVSHELQHWQARLLRESDLWDIRQNDSEMRSWHAPPPWAESSPSFRAREDLSPPAIAESFTAPSDPGERSSSPSSPSLPREG